MADTTINYGTVETLDMTSMNSLSMDAESGFE